MADVNTVTMISRFPYDAATAAQALRIQHEFNVGDATYEEWKRGHSGNTMTTS